MIDPTVSLSMPCPPMTGLHISIFPATVLIAKILLDPQVPTGKVRLLPFVDYDQTPLSLPCDESLSTEIPGDTKNVQFTTLGTSLIANAFA